jgi:FKBP-type peptidyl-prolyl cis-trans isomerase
MTRFQWSLDFQINEGAKHTMKKWIILLALLSLVLTITLFAEGKVVTTSSGLKYIDHKVGAGDEAVKGATVNVHYTGWLYVDGKRGQKFDSSVDRGQPFSFKLGAGQVIKGWDEGVQGMKVGGKRELIIPPDLGYGSRGARGAIPPGATLDFEVELLKVSK